MILTTEQAAAELGVSSRRVTQLVEQGKLEPCRRGAKPMRFRLDVVIEYAHRSMPKAKRDTLAALSDEWREVVRDVCYR